MRRRPKRTLQTLPAARADSRAEEEGLATRQEDPEEDARIQATADKLLETTPERSSFM